jgi:dephospho-CoA kinase
MIIGITGAICAGKRAFAKYLEEKYGFELVNLLELFKIELHKIGLPVEVQSSPHKKRD